MKQKSNSIFLTIIGVLILILAVIGVSYAAVFYSKTGERVNNITTGTITMSYSENTNGINLTDAYPLADSVGKKLSQANQFFDFTVSANLGGNVAINYIVTATKETDSTLPDSAVKVYLSDLNKEEAEVLAPTKISNLHLTNNSLGGPDNQFILTTDTFTEAGTHRYRLRMWLADDYAITNDIKTYKLRVNVYGEMEV